LQTLAALHVQRPKIVIGFEMFPRRLQPILDQWVAGALGALGVTIPPMAATEGSFLAAGRRA
jgi:hypothetical protein